MLIEKNFAKQNLRQLKKGFASYQKQIEAHTAKILSPALYVPDWDSYTEKHQAGPVRHWQKEIRFFQRSIDDRIAELKNRGDYNA